MMRHVCRCSLKRSLSWLKLCADIRKRMNYTEATDLLSQDKAVSHPQLHAPSWCCGGDTCSPLFWQSAVSPCCSHSPLGHQQHAATAVGRLSAKCTFRGKHSLLLAAWCCDQWNSLCSATALLLFLDQEQQLPEAGARRKQREGGFFQSSHVDDGLERMVSKVGESDGRSGLGENRMFDGQGLGQPG